MTATTNVAVVTLRPPVPSDALLLTEWDHLQHVISCTTDDPDATVARDTGEWEQELASPTPHWEHLVAEANGRPVGAMLIIDPALEPTHYWGDIEADLRAIDIWIGPEDALGRGYGTAMMTQAIERCFAKPDVKAIVIDPLTSNVDAHRFYQRLGFRVVGPQRFGEDECLVHRLERCQWQMKKTVDEPVSNSVLEPATDRKGSFSARPSRWPLTNGPLRAPT